MSCNRRLSDARQRYLSARRYPFEARRRRLTTAWHFRCRARLADRTLASSNIWRRPMRSRARERSWTSACRIGPELEAGCGGGWVLGRMRSFVAGPGLRLARSGVATESSSPQLVFAPARATLQPEQSPTPRPMMRTATPSFRRSKVRASLTQISRMLTPRRSCSRSALATTEDSTCERLLVWRRLHER